MKYLTKLKLSTRGFRKVEHCHNIEMKPVAQVLVEVKEIKHFISHSIVILMQIWYHNLDYLMPKKVYYISK